MKLFRFRKRGERATKANESGGAAGKMQTEPEAGNHSPGKARQANRGQSVKASPTCWNKIKKEAGSEKTKRGSQKEQTGGPPRGKQLRRQPPPYSKKNGLPPGDTKNQVPGEKFSWALKSRNKPCSVGC